MNLSLALLPNPQFQPPNEAVNLGDVLPIVLAIIVFVVAPISIAIARAIWVRFKAPSQESTALMRGQLEEVQRSIDALAVEMERISENQRFVSKLLADRSLDKPALPPHSPPKGVQAAPRAS